MANERPYQQECDLFHERLMCALACIPTVRVVEASVKLDAVVDALALLWPENLQGFTYCTWPLANHKNVGGADAAIAYIVDFVTDLLLSLYDPEDATRNAILCVDRMRFNPNNATLCQRVVVPTFSGIRLFLPDLH